MSKKPAKRSPGPALVRGMKQHLAAVKSGKPLKSTTRCRSCGNDIDAERKLGEVRSMCEETLRWDAKHYMASKVLRIINSTPTAKGGRK